MFRTTTAKKNFGYIKKLLNDFDFKCYFDDKNDYFTYSLNITVSKLKELLSKNTFYNHLRNEDGLLETSSLTIKYNDKDIFKATIVDDDLIGMPKYNLIQILKQLDISTELKLEIGLMNLYYKELFISREIKITKSLSLDKVILSHLETEVFLTYTSKIQEFTEFFKVQLNGIDVTEKYYRFLQKNKISQKNWRYNKVKNHFSVGTNSGSVIFASIEEEQLKEFILDNINQS